MRFYNTWESYRLEVGWGAHRIVIDWWYLYRKRLTVRII